LDADAAAMPIAPADGAERGGMVDEDDAADMATAGAVENEAGTQANVSKSGVSIIVGWR